MSTFEHAFCIAALVTILMALLHTALALAQAIKSVEVLVIVGYPALDAIRDGIKEQFKAGGFDAGKNLKWEYQSAQGSTATAAQITYKFINDKPDAIVAIATPSTQTAVTVTKSVPAVCSGVTDPVTARLVKSWVPTGASVTGVSDKLSLDKQTALIKRVVLDVKRVGMVYDPDEANSVVAITGLKKLLSAQGVMLVELTVLRTVDIASTVKNPIGKVDVIYTNTDGNVVSVHESLVKAANEAKIPLVVGGIDGVKRGAIATLGVNYYKLDQQTNKVVACTLKGEKSGATTSAGSPDPELFVNESTTKKQGATLPTDLLKDTKEVIK